jgi:hypothetical protein
MEDDTFGYRVGGFFRQGTVRAGFQLVGLGEELDGSFTTDTGGEGLRSKFRLPRSPVHARPK